MERVVFDGSTTLAKKFHNLPHLNFKLHHINNTLFQVPPKSVGSHLSNYEYGQSLVVTGSFLVALGVFVCLVFALFSCCWWYRKKRQDASLQYVPLTPPKRHYLAVIGSLILVVAGCIAAGYSFKSRQDIHHAVNTIKDQVDDVDSMLNDGIKSGEDIQSDVLDLQTMLNDFLSSIPPTLPIPDTTLDALNGMIDDILTQINEYLIDARTVEVPPEINDSLTEFNNIYGILSIVMSLLGFLFLISLGVRMFFDRKKRSLMWLSKWLAVLLILVVWAWISVSIVVAVAAADICVDTDNTTEQALNEISDDPFEREVVDFYITCDGVTVNPLNTNLEEAMDAIGETQTAVQNIVMLLPQVPNLDPSVGTQLDDIDTKLGSIDSKLIDLETMLDCVRVHNDYTRVQMSLCHTILNSLGISILCFAAAVAAAMISAFMCCHQKRDSAEEWKAMRWKSNSKSDVGNGFRSSHSQGLLDQSPIGRSPEVELNLDSDDSRHGSLQQSGGGRPSYAIRPSGDATLPVLIRMES